MTLRAFFRLAREFHRMPKRIHFECPRCGFRRSHRILSGGYDGYLAMWRVQLHMLLRDHRSR